MGSGLWRKDTIVLILCLVAYATCNSTMLVLNKLCITYIPSPNAILFSQLGFNAAFVYLLSKIRVIECDALELHKVSRFAPVVICFVLLLFTNLRAIARVPVDTFICARASLPCVTSIFEFVFLGRQLPSLRSFASLVFIATGVLLYVRSDVKFDASGYMWLGIWYCLSLLENLWVKHIMMTLEMTQWGRSLYTNLLSLPFCFALAAGFDEFRTMREQVWTIQSSSFLLLSCFAGVAMSYTSFLLRDLISATSFAVVGNICKLNTLLINYFIWEKHASLEGIRALLITLAGAAFYEQAPYRETEESVLQHLRKRMMMCLGVTPAIQHAASESMK